MNASIHVSSTNPDFCGTWTKDEVLNEMAEVGVAESDDYSWLDWIFSHDFDDECPNELIDLVKLSTVTQASVTIFINGEKTVINYFK